MIRRHFACVGVGIGPANLSLASLLYDDADVPNLFLERSPNFGWHDGQLVSGATLQVSMLKDLVTLSDPTNPFSFLSYLHSEGRIYHFINAQFDAVPRREWRNYLEWVSRRNPNLEFGEEVLAVSFDGRNFVVTTSNREVTAENVVVGVGQQPWVPSVAAPLLGAEHFHMRDFNELGVGVGGKRVCVVGGGQSGAEAFLDLISRADGDLPRRVSWVSRRPNFFPIDDSPFTNDYYMPDYAQYFYGLPQQRRLAFNARNVLTSDGISESTLREIYQRIYVHRFIDGAPDLVALYPNRQVTEVESAEPGGWSLTLVANEEPVTCAPAEQVEADVVVWATGYRPGSREFLAPIADRLEYEGDELRIDEDYAARWDGPSDRNVFLQNAARGQRGLADPNLSLLAWRSQRIADRLRGVRSTEQLAGFVDWAPKNALVRTEGA
jgi:lysine N6-hydroxylase